MFDFLRGNKRKHYRVSQSTDSSISAQLTLDADTLVKAQVIDTSVGGAGLLFQAADASSLSVGSSAAIAFKSERSQRVITADARVARIAKSAEGSVVVGFQFVSGTELLAQLDTKWWSYFNRRESYRVLLETQKDFNVNLITAGTVHRGLRVRDLSPEGLGLIIPLDAAPTYAVDAQFRVAFRLPQLEHAMSLSGSLVHVTAREEAVLLGLRFESDGTPDYDERYRKMVEYTLRLQARTPS